MASEAFVISEGLQWLLIAMALIISFFFLIRYLSFYLKVRKNRKQDMDLALELGKRLKQAKLRSLDEIMDEEDDEMFQKVAKGAGKAKPLKIPASYEARVGKTAAKALKPRRKRATRKKVRKNRRKPAA